MGQVGVGEIMKELVVENKYNCKKLVPFLLDNFDGLCTNTIYKALRKKDIRINDIKVNSNVFLQTGDSVKIFISDEFLFKQNHCNFNKVYEDDNILIIDKPAEIEVTGSDSITSILKRQYAYIEPCHRLDRNTTGLLIFAKNKDALDILLQKFKNREIEKHYKAMVYGIPNIKSQTLEAYLFKDNKKALVYISDTPQKGYVKIVTSYKVLEKNIEKNYCILDIQLHTGKTHQIRAHLAHIGYPIIGDGKYGINKINKQFGYKTQQLCSSYIKFNFKTDAKILNYLSNKDVSLLDRT
ncbi:MAG TPA: RluA family pseudouridine synthase [Clostridiales bacterium]|nr:RluA family pseudouridine synthase [Clostridiales bacterium]